VPNISSFIAEKKKEERAAEQGEAQEGAQAAVEAPPETAPVVSSASSSEQPSLIKLALAAKVRIGMSKRVERTNAPVQAASGEEPTAIRTASIKAK